MQHMALLALEDHEVDLLSRARQRDDVRLGAVYHPDPAALVVRLAGLAHVPVVFDIEALAALPIDFCVGGENAAQAIRELAGRASREGKAAPVFVPAGDFDLYLKDPSSYVARQATPAPDGGDAAAPAGKDAGSGAGSTTERKQSPIDPEGPTAEMPVAPERPAPVVTSATAPITSSGGRREEHREAGPVATPETAQAFDPGSPPLRDLFDPVLLSRWITGAALKAGGGFSSVLWKREAEGQRYALMSFAPDADRLPTVSFPPGELETHVRAGTPRVVDPPRPPQGADGGPQFKMLAVPLAGDRGAFGLLGIFRRVADGPFPESFVAAVGSKSTDYGVALERSVEFSGMGAELRSLRFKERVRDLMLDSRVPASERWSRLLDFLVMETQADFAQFLRVSDDRARLSLEAAAGLSGDFEGWVSIPVGRGMAGRALERRSVTVYTADEMGDDRGVYLLPVRSGREEDALPIGVIVLDGAVDANASGEETRALLQIVGDIVAPLLKAPVAGRA